MLGCGYWGSKHVRVLSQLPDVNVEVIDVREDRRDELLQTFPNVSAHSDLDEVLDELDAVVVATPASTHGDLALKAINAGVVVMAGHTFEFNPAVRKLAEIIRQPSFGEVLYLDSLRLNLGLYQPDVNVVCDLAAHDISIFNYLIGREPTSVAAWTARHAKSQGPDDVAYLQFEYDDITANIHVSWLYPAKVRQTTVVGRNQMAVYNDLSDDERVRVYHKGVDHDDDSLHPLVSHRRHHQPLHSSQRATRTRRRALLALRQNGRNARDKRTLRARRRARPRGCRNSGPAPGARSDRCRVTCRGAAMKVPFVDLAADHAERRTSLDAAWSESLDASGFVGGDAVEAFEQRWAEYCGTTHAIGVANGTDALELSLTATGIGRGDEVIVPANTFISTASAVVATGARPVFVDVDAETLLLTPDHIYAAAGPRTAAIIVVHLFDNVADMTAICEAADGLDIAVIEDAAQAHGARHDGQRVGSFGLAGTFSFYPAKNLGALGDGGAVVTNDAVLAARIRSLADHGRPPASKHDHTIVGRNSRLDALQARFLTVKLAKLDERNHRRRAAALWYDQRLPLATSLVAAKARSENVFHLAVVRCRERDRVRAEVGAKGVQTGVHYAVPCHRQPPFADGAPSLQVVEDAAMEILSIPMHPHLDAQQIDYVTTALGNALVRTAA